MPYASRRSQRATKFALALITLATLTLLALQTAPQIVRANSQAAGVPITKRVTNPSGGVLARANAATNEVGAWSALANSGLDGTVRAVAVYNNELYVGGEFNYTADGSKFLAYIAKYNGTTWTALPNLGLNGAVTAFAVYGGNLYVGGSFSKTGDGTVTLNRLGKFNGTSWSAVANAGLSSTVTALAVYGDQLVVGGSFLKTGDNSITLNHIAMYNGAAWSPFPGVGLNGNVYALLGSGFDLYVGGGFTNTGTPSTALNYIARFDGSDWNALGNNGLNNTVYSLALFNGETYAGGAFTTTVSPNVALNHIAKFDLTTWTALPNDGLSDTVNVIYASDTALFVGGAFAGTADSTVEVSNIAALTNNTWSPLSQGGVNGAVRAITLYNNALFVSGTFTASATGATTLNRIARLALATQTGPTFIVNSFADTDDGLCDTLGQGTGNKNCTLREAINAANAHSGADTINFSGSLAVSLSDNLPTITGDLTIDGGNNPVSVNGNNSYRIFDVADSVSFTLVRLLLAGGKANTDLDWGKSGGAINTGTGVLTIRSTAFSGNSADTYGGAILTSGSLTISNSTFYNNSAGSAGGGISVNTATILNSTFSNNSSPTGASIQADVSVTLKNTILANAATDECSATATSDSVNNLVESANTCDLTNGENGNLLGIDPRLDTFAYNGGVVPVYSLRSDSSAIDKGSNTVCAAAPVSNQDQRGITRPIDGDSISGAVCDIGAYEAPLFTTPTSTLTPTPTLTPTVPACSTKPAIPTLLKPTKNQVLSKTKVKFDWDDAACATSYKITVKNTTTGAKVTKTVTPSKATLTLAHGKQKWSVQACNSHGCTKSKNGKFQN